MKLLKWAYDDSDRCSKKWRNYSLLGFGNSHACGYTKNHKGKCQCRWIHGGTTKWCSSKK